MKGYINEESLTEEEHSPNKGWRLYRSKWVTEMRPYIVGEDVSGVSISDADRGEGSPKEGDMIARNLKNHDVQWLVSKSYFEGHLEPCS